MKNSSYSKLSTFKLIAKIAYQADVRALNEILSFRKLFKLNNKRYLLSDFLFELRKQKFTQYIAINKNKREVDEYIDEVYDKTLNKFLFLKPKTKYKNNKSPYCNTRYLNLYKKINKDKQKNAIKWELESEDRVDTIFRDYVILQIKYSWLETLREKDILHQRYRWFISGQYVELKKPKWINGHALRKWLDKNVKPFLGNNLDKQKIQEFIDIKYGYCNLFSIDDQNILAATDIAPDEIFEQEDNNVDLYKIIADEKANSIEEQRPAIRKLGKEKLKQMILNILNNITEPGYKDIEIAQEYNLSKASFSRFAGHDWYQNIKDRDPIFIPDLWKNMTSFIHREPNFLNAAIELGIQDVIDLIIKE